MKKLQRQAILEAEIVRLRALLLDLRGKINNELGDFPFQKRSSTFTEGECGIQPTDVNGLACGLAGSSVLSNGIDGCGKTMAAWETDCQPAIVDCQASRNYIQSAEKRLQDSLETLISSAPQEE
ncbi:UNVERIFIED_CONTAM: hypothetical protein Sradi_2672200 [Sesamum radiatum]|uniref:Uncharacterized protein n=1 Tax=Sesamum radiatum TaxID=300843 RepID=A0AAW2S703_SESRA